MGIIEITLTSIGLATDAFAASICKGLSIKQYNLKKGLIIGIYFGLFQGTMPLIGYLLGSLFQDIIVSIDHWIAFILLSIIGINMIIESLNIQNEKHNSSLNIKTMLPLAIATSIDALAIGVTLAFLKVNIIIAILSIGLITFILSVIGSKLGNKVGTKFQKKSQIIGGLILIIIGLKILLEHLGIF